MRQRISELAHPLGIVLPAEHAIDDRHIAEQIGDDAMVRLAFDVVEEDRTASIHVLLQAGNLKVRIDFLVGLDQLAGCAQPFQRAAQIEGLVRHRARLWVAARVLAELVFAAHYLLHGSRPYCMEC